MDTTATTTTTATDLTMKPKPEPTIIEHNPSVPTVTIKQEPGTRIITTSTSSNGTCYLKQPTIVLSTQRQIQPINVRPERIIVPKVNIKVVILVKLPPTNFA